MKKTNFGVLSALLAAILYALSTPFSKILLKGVSATMLAGFLYLGAGLGMGILFFCSDRSAHRKQEKRLTRKDLPYTISMIFLDILAPIFLMWGLLSTPAASVSLLNNFEIVATAMLAMLFFHEKVGFRLWFGILLITFSCILLSVEDFSSLSFSSGSLLVLLAALCWGLENNCTRKLSSKNPLQIVFLKGIFSGSGSLIIALFMGERFPSFPYLILALLLGSISYGFSIYAYIYAQRFLGAAKTGAFYSVAPFVAVVLSLLLFRELPGEGFIPALILMLAGMFFLKEN